MMTSVMVLPPWEAHCEKALLRLLFMVELLLTVCCNEDINFDKLEVNFRDVDKS